MPTASINLLAVFVSAIIGMAIGALWYSPILFGKVWMKLSGKTKEDIAKAKSKGIAKNYIIAFLGVLLMSYVLAHFIDYTGAKTVLDGAVAGFWLWLGFVATVTLSSVLWEGKSIKLYILNNAHNLAVLIVMGAMLAIWV